MAGKNAFQGLLAHRDDHVIDVYRGEQLPELEQVITVETALSPVPVQNVRSCRARMTRVIPSDKFPVQAVELER